jgi:iron-sulfur cluster repair protein YtfE (RIC family)
MGIHDELRREHAHLHHGIEELKRLGDGVGRDPVRETVAGVQAAVRFLHAELLPAGRWDDDVLYPLVGRVLGSPRATLTMSWDHAEVERMAGQLERAAEEFDEPMLRRLLYGLYHVIRLHLVKEEELYGPLLDEALSPDQADELVRGLRAA